MLGILSGVVSLISGFVWKHTREEVAGAIALVCGVFFIGVLLLSLLTLADLTGQVIQEWTNQIIS